MPRRYFRSPAITVDTASDLLWKLAPPIQALNLAFVALNDQSLRMRVCLLHGEGEEWRAEHKLASALSAASQFRWDQVRPQLNAVLVHAILSRTRCAHSKISSEVSRAYTHSLVQGLGTVYVCRVTHARVRSVETQLRSAIATSLQLDGQGDRTLTIRIGLSDLRFETES